MSGTRPGLPERGDRVQCLHCGRWFRSLGPHLRFAGITAADYRAEHRLPSSTALMASGTRGVLSQTRRTQMETDPSLVQRMRDATPDIRDVAARSAVARAGTDDLPAVRDARAAGARRTVSLARAGLSARMDARARAAGYADADDAISRTAHMTVAAAAQHLGYGMTTIKRRRKTLCPGERVREMKAIDVLAAQARDYDRLAEATEQARDRLYEAIRDAVRGGVTKTEVSRASGVSRPTIDKILG